MVCQAEEQQMQRARGEKHPERCKIWSEYGSRASRTDHERARVQG
jgi:hypothetical protein